MFPQSNPHVYAANLKSNEKNWCCFSGVPTIEPCMVYKAGLIAMLGPSLITKMRNHPCPGMPLRCLDGLRLSPSPKPYIPKPYTLHTKTPKPYTPKPLSHTPLNRYTLNLQGFECGVRGSKLGLLVGDGGLRTSEKIT